MASTRTPTIISTSWLSNRIRGHSSCARALPWRLANPNNNLSGGALGYFQCEYHADVDGVREFVRAEYFSYLIGMEVEFRTTPDDYVAFYQYFYFRRKLGLRILYVALFSPVIANGTREGLLRFFLRGQSAGFQW